MGENNNDNCQNHKTPSKLIIAHETVIKNSAS